MFKLISGHHLRIPLQPHFSKEINHYYSPGKYHPAGEDLRNSRHGCWKYSGKYFVGGGSLPVNGAGGGRRVKNGEGLCSMGGGRRWRKY